LSAEIAVIVVGILLALAADDWWTGRRERIEEAEILRELEDDLVTSKELLGMFLTLQAQLLRDIQVLSGGSTGKASESEDAELRRMVWHALWEVYVEVPHDMGAYQEVKDSGRVRLIDPAIRRTLAEFDRRLTRTTLTSVDALQHQTTKVDPYILQSLRLSEFSSIALQNVENAVQLETRGDATDYRSLLDDDTFQNLIAAKYYLQTFSHDRRLELMEVINELEMLTNARLAQLDR
jgi:hypothetical protein